MWVVCHIGTPGLSRGLTRFNVKSTTRGNSQLLSILCTADGLHRPRLDLVLFPLCPGGWGVGVGLCVPGKPFIPELHPEFHRALAFSGACLPSCVKKCGVGECLGLGSCEM